MEFTFQWSYHAPHIFKKSCFFLSLFFLFRFFSSFFTNISLVNIKQKMILTFYWGQNEENYHGSNTMFLVGVLMSVVGGIFVVFTIMALCYRSAIVHRKLLSCLRLVCLIPSSKPKKYSDKSDTLYRPSFLFPSNILQQLCSSHQKKTIKQKSIFTFIFFLHFRLRSVRCQTLICIKSISNATQIHQASILH